VAHILLLEAPGGNDFTVLEDAVAMGHAVTFFTGDLEQYRRQGDATQACLALCREAVEVRPFEYAAFERQVLAIHESHPFDAVLCILDIRIIEASQIAQRLGLRFLNPETAKMARDKFSVRCAMARAGLRQPPFALAESPQDLRRAAEEIGFPMLVKPSDGFGSQNVSVLTSLADLDARVDALEAAAAEPTDYGLGVLANNRLLVERYVHGNLIGCDVFSDGKERRLIGVNDKLMYPPPSFAIRGSCFPSSRYDTAALADYAFAILDAMGFDFGAAHIEMIVAQDEPYLVEVNPRLVSAQIPFQMAYALERSVYADLINLHLCQPVAALDGLAAGWYCAIRWIVADRPGRILTLTLPESAPEAIRRVVLFKGPGDPVTPPMSNGDRIGYVMAAGDSQRQAEEIAERYVDSCALLLG
jgi:biotin carboxylase